MICSKFRDWGNILLQVFFRKKILTTGDFKEGRSYHHRTEAVFSVDEKVSPRCKPDLITVSANRRRHILRPVAVAISTRRALAPTRYTAGLAHSKKRRSGMRQIEILGLKWIDLQFSLVGRCRDLEVPPLKKWGQTVEAMARKRALQDSSESGCGSCYRRREG